MQSASLSEGLVAQAESVSWPDHLEMVAPFHRHFPPLPWTHAPLFLRLVIQQSTGHPPRRRPAEFQHVLLFSEFAVGPIDAQLAEQMFSLNSSRRSVLFHISNSGLRYRRRHATVDVPGRQLISDDVLKLDISEEISEKPEAYEAVGQYLRLLSLMYLVRCHNTLFHAGWRVDVEVHETWVPARAVSQRFVVETRFVNPMPVHLEVLRAQIR